MLFQELFPANKRSCEHFAKYFTDAGLKELSDFVKNQQTIGARKELQKELQQQISQGEPLKDVRLFSLLYIYPWVFIYSHHYKKNSHHLLTNSVSGSDFTEVMESRVIGIMHFILLFTFVITGDTSHLWKHG